MDYYSFRIELFRILRGKFGVVIARKILEHIPPCWQFCDVCQRLTLPFDYDFINRGGKHKRSPRIVASRLYAKYFPCSPTVPHTFCEVCQQLLTDKYYERKHKRYEQKNLIFELHQKARTYSEPIKITGFNFYSK